MIDIQLNNAHEQGTHVLLKCTILRSIRLMFKSVCHLKMTQKYYRNMQWVRIKTVAILGSCVDGIVIIILVVILIHELR
jgi:hypothetical protein